MVKEQHAALKLLQAWHEAKVKNSQSLANAVPSLLQSARAPVDASALAADSAQRTCTQAPRRRAERASDELRTRECGACVSDTRETQRLSRLYSSSQNAARLAAKLRVSELRDARRRPST